MIFFHQIHVMISSLVAVSQANKDYEPIRALQLGWKGVGLLSPCQSEKKKKAPTMDDMNSLAFNKIHLHNENSLNVMTNANPRGQLLRLSEGIVWTDK